MEIINEVVTVGNKDIDLKVIDVEILHDMVLLVEFSNGEKKIFDVNQMLKYPVFQKLKDKTVFNSINLKNGIVVWDDENIDIGTDYLYKNSENYTQD